MAARVRIEMNDAGVRELLTSAAITADVEARARRIAEAAGPGMTVEMGGSHERARAVVVTETEAAKVAEARDRALTRAVEAGR